MNIDHLKKPAADTYAALLATEEALRQLHASLNALRLAIAPHMTWAEFLAFIEAPSVTTIAQDTFSGGTDKDPPPSSGVGG